MAQVRHKGPTYAAPPTRADEATTAVETELPSGFSELLQRRRAGDRIISAVVEDITPDGVPLVVLSGDTQSRAASSLLRFPSAAAASAAILGRTVLVLESGSSQPIILGIVSDRLWEPSEGASAAHVELPEGSRTLQVDKRRLDLEASDEIRLTCGKSLLLLRRDGTVIVRGVTITSRASQTNKIRGATVNIN